MRLVPTALCALGALLLLAGCTDAGPGGSAVAAKQHVPLRLAPDPAIKEAVTADASFDVGHTVHITATGIRPLSLASLCCDPIVFKNETSAPISIVFDVYKTSSGSIAPGATWSWTPHNPESLTFHLGSEPSSHGHIQIESPDW